jgi:hypothetical protein
VCVLLSRLRLRVRVRDQQVFSSHLD